MVLRSNDNVFFLFCIEIPSDDLQANVTIARYNFLMIKWIYNSSLNLLRFETKLNCTETPDVIVNTVPANSTSCQNESCYLPFNNLKEDENCTFSISPVYSAGTGDSQQLMAVTSKIGLFLFMYVLLLCFHAF